MISDGDYSHIDRKELLELFKEITENYHVEFLLMEDGTEAVHLTRKVFFSRLPVVPQKSA